MNDSNRKGILWNVSEYVEMESGETSHAQFRSRYSEADIPLAGQSVHLEIYLDQHITL
jgi:hypothetical protein